MKKNGIYNAKLSEVVGKMGHGDIILIGDVGCPFPRQRVLILQLQMEFPRLQMW